MPQTALEEAEELNAAAIDELDSFRDEIEVSIEAVSYTHLTLPTIYSV